MVKEEQLDPYLRKGMDLIPLHVWNKQIRDRKGKMILRGKTPLYNDWTKRPEDSQHAIEKSKKGFNVGFRIPRNILVIDVDPRNGGKAGLKKLNEFLGISDLADKCPTVLTGGGGWHYYLNKPEEIDIREVTDEFQGIEFKTNGRQVVAAGSRHPSGTYYEWDDFSVPLEQIPNTPKKLLELLKYVPKEYGGDAGELNPADIEYLLNQLPVEEYGENDSWFKIMCAAHYATDGSGIEEFLHWSLSDTEFAEDEGIIRARWDSLKQKLSSITTATLYKEVKSHGGDITQVVAQKEFQELEDLANGPTLDEGIDPFDDIISEGELQESYKPGLATRMAEALLPNSDEETIVAAIRAMLQSGTVERVTATKIMLSNLKWAKGDLNAVIKQMEDKILLDMGRILAEKTIQTQFNDGKDIVFNANAQFWIYIGTHWVPVNKQYIGKFVMDTLDNMRVKINIDIKENTLISEALEIMARITSTRDDALRLGKRPFPIINCKNGEVWTNVKTGEVKLKRHKPNSFLIQVLDVEYDPSAECPTFDAAIRRTFSKFKDSEDIVRHFEEFMGYVIQPNKDLASWWLLKGPGGDGKSTLMEILCGLLGNAVLPEDIKQFSSTGDKHIMERLVGAYLVYDDDLDKNAKLPSGPLKKISENKLLSANPKGRDAYNFINCAVPVMCSNGFPKSGDLTAGFRRRANVIPFNMQFHKEENQGELGLSRRIIKTELSGVLNRALAGLQRLRDRGRFLPPDSCIAAANEWLNDSDPVAAFMNEKILITDDYDDSVDIAEIHQTFVDWCSVSGVRFVPSRQQLKTSLMEMEITTSAGSGRKHIFHGLKIHENVENEFEELDDF